MDSRSWLPRNSRIIFLILLVAPSSRMLAQTLPEFSFSESDPTIGLLSIPQLEYEGKVAFEDVIFEFNLATGTFSVPTLRAADDRLTIVPVTSITDGVQVTGSWSASGGSDFESLRNHHYVIEILSGGVVDIELNSNLDEHLYLLDNLGIVIDETSFFSNSLSLDLEPGSYTVVAATRSSGGAADYTLSLTGPISAEVKRVNSRMIEYAGSWESSGGSSIESFRNGHYLFEVDYDSYLEISIDSNVNTTFYLLDSLGISVATEFGDRLRRRLNAGTYELVVATQVTGESGNYVLTLNGEVSGFRERISNTFNIVGSWDSSGGPDPESPANPSYSFDVTEQSLLDITFNSSVPDSLYLLDENGIVLSSTFSSRLTRTVEPGRYRLVPATSSIGESANFVINVYGLVENLSEDER